MCPCSARQYLYFYTSKSSSTLRALTCFLALLVLRLHQIDKPKFIHAAVACKRRTAGSSYVSAYLPI
jgi:hypothetical protein